MTGIGLARMHWAIALAVCKRIHHPLDAPRGLASGVSVSRRSRDQEEEEGGTWRES